MSLGLKISELRDKKGLSQDELAVEIGVSKSAVSLWELGKSKPASKKLNKLAAFFEVSVEYLKGLESPKLDNGDIGDEVRALKEALGDISSKLYVEQEKNKALRAEIKNLTDRLAESQGTKNTGT